MILHNLIEKLGDPETKVLAATLNKIRIEYKIQPIDSFKQAEKDLKDNVYSNCLSNSKRALEGQINSILIALGFKNKAKKNFPTKIDFLIQLGISAPRILSRINSTRNLFEHEFEMPNNEIVEDFLNITELFMVSTNHYLTSFPEHFTIANKNEGIHVNVHLNYKFCQISLNDQRLYDNGKHLNIAKYYSNSLEKENKIIGDKNENVKSIILDTSNNEYIEIIKFLIAWKQE